MSHVVYGTVNRRYYRLVGLERNSAMLLMMMHIDDDDDATLIGDDDMTAYSDRSVLVA